MGKAYPMYVLTVSMEKEFKIVSEDEEKAEEAFKDILSREENLIIGSVKILDCHEVDVEIIRPS